MMLLNPAAQRLITRPEPRDWDRLLEINDCRVPQDGRLLNVGTTRAKTTPVANYSNFT